MASHNDRYVVGLFEEPTHATTVTRELKDAGFSSGDVHSYDRGDSRGLTDKLTDHGVPEQHAHYYAEGVRRGGCLVSVNSDEEHYASAVEIMRRHGAVDVNRLARYYQSSGFKRHDESQKPYSEQQINEDRQKYRQYDDSQHRGGETVLPEMEEHVEIGKERVQTGGVRIFRRQTQKPVEKDVHLREEHVDVQRRKVDRPATEQDKAAFREGEVTVTETSERPVVNKKQVVTEEVRVGKEAEERVERVRDVARKQEVEVEHVKGDRGGASANPPGGRR